MAGRSSSQIVLARSGSGGSSASTVREPASLPFSWLRRARRRACPWERPFCGLCASVFSVPACLQLWWCLPRITSFTAIFSNRPAFQADKTYRITGNSPRRKRHAVRSAPELELHSATASHPFPAYNGNRHASGKKPACSAPAVPPASDELRTPRVNPPATCLPEFVNAF